MGGFQGEKQKKRGFMNSRRPTMIFDEQTIATTHGSTSDRLHIRPINGEESQVTKFWRILLSLLFLVSRVDGVCLYRSRLYSVYRLRFDSPGPSKKNEREKKNSPRIDHQTATELRPTRG